MMIYPFRFCIFSFLLVLWDNRGEGKPTAIFASEFSSFQKNNFKMLFLFFFRYLEMAAGANVISNAFSHFKFSFFGNLIGYRFVSGLQTRTLYIPFCLLRTKVSFLLLQGKKVRSRIILQDFSHRSK